MSNNFGMPATGSGSPPTSNQTHGHSHSQSASMSLGSPRTFGQNAQDSNGSAPQSSTFMPPGTQAPPNSLNPNAGGGSLPDGPPQREGQVRRGVCKFFNSQKGFGFVLDNKPEDLGGQEVFVHYTAIQSRTGFRSLAEGEEVEYEITTGNKGFQAVRLTGPNGRSVIGDPKARLVKQPNGFMQMAPLGFQPGQYGMDPYMQQHPGAVYGASPYNAHVVYVPQAMAGQQQYAAQMMGGNGQYPMQMNSYNNNGGNRQNMMGQQQQQQGQNQQQAAGGFGQNNSGSFGPVGGMASTAGMSGYQQQQQQGSYGGGNANGYGANTQRYGATGNSGLDNEGFSGFGPGSGNQDGSNQDGAGGQAGSFFGSGNVFYSGN